MKNTIYLQTNSQVTLLTQELMGQFSDGLWENSRNKFALGPFMVHALVVHACCSFFLSNNTYH